jgi:mRNA interferase HicA
VKRADLIRHPDAHGCLLFREGAKHSVYFNPAAQRTSIVPRQRVVKNRQLSPSASNSACPTRASLKRGKAFIMIGRSASLA